MRKAQIGLQFNWIFIFIAGAIILLFFLLVIKSQTKGADYELAGEIIKNLDTIVKSSGQSSDGFKTIKMPEVKIEFVCEEDLSFYDIGNGVTKDIPYDIIFSQEELSGKELISWTKSWNLPFKIASFQYLTTKKAQFIVINDTNGLAEELFEILPNNITKKLIETNVDINDENYDYYKIIQFDGSLQQQQVSKPSDAHKITINATNGLDSHGTITFDDNGQIKTLNFLKKESLLGAIFAEDADFYNCTMNKAFERLKILMTLNNNRTSELNSSTLHSGCTTAYEWLLESFREIMSHLSLTDSDTIFEHSDKIARNNEHLMRGRKCPLIY